MNKTKIVINKRKIIASSAENDFINILLIIFIIDEFTKERTKDTSLDQVAFIYDIVIKDKPIDSLYVKLSKPWAVPYNYRELIIMASEKDFININKKGSDIALSLNTAGANILETIKQEDLFTVYRQTTIKAVKAFKKVDYSLQNLIW